MKKISFTIIFLFGIILSVSAQEYYIEGFYERHGNGNYTLKNVHTQGITIDGQTNFPTKVFQGKKVHIPCEDNVEATLVEFSFEKANTKCPTRWDKGVRFQFWDEDVNKWKDDIEACKVKTKGYSQKNMVIMLILDYSSSMKNNISQIQNYAINFINSISEVSKGNVHVGIIAFSGMDKADHQVFSITPLKSDTRNKFEEFIRTSTMGKETALYYSMDKAIGMIENYVEKEKFSPKDFNGACMITFTDGLDNASINDNISLNMHRGSKNEYLAYLSEQLSGPSQRVILESPLESFVVGFTGSEDFSSDDIALFKNVLQKTTPDEEHFELASRFEQVEDYFKQITRQLFERWETLNMYVGEAQHGRIRWVLNCVETPRPLPPTPPTPKTIHKVFLGFNLTIGLPMDFYYESTPYYSSYNDYYSDSPYSYTQFNSQRYTSAFGIGISPRVGVDFAWPLSEYFAIGAYLNGGPNIMFNTWMGFEVKAGLFMLVGKLSAKPFIIGITPCAGFAMAGGEYVPVELRFGKIISKHFYITGNFSGGIPCDEESCFMMTPSVSLGIHLGDKIKISK